MQGRCRNRVCLPFAAFSLLEVVAAVAIVAVGMIAVLGLFVPIVRSIATSSDAEAAAAMAEAVRSRLLTLRFEAATALLQDEEDVRRREGKGSAPATTGGLPPAVLLGLKGGGVAIYDPAGTPPGWYDANVPPRLVPRREARFEIDLIRHPGLSPRSGDATAAVLAFNVRVRWPVFAPAADGNASNGAASSDGDAPVPYDNHRKQVLFLSGTLTR